MSGRMLQGLVLQMKEATDRVIGVLDSLGAIVACSDLTLIGEKRETAANALYESNDAICVFEGFTYKPLSNLSVRFDYAVFVEGEDDYANSICMMASVALNNAKSFYDEKQGKARPIKELIQEKFGSDDYYSLTKEQKQEIDAQRLAFEDFAPINWCIFQNAAKMHQATNIHLYS